MEEFNDITKKSNKGLVAAIIILIILLLGALGGTYYIWNNMKKDFDSLNKELKQAKISLEKEKSENIEVLEEGYITLRENPSDNNEVKIYSVVQYGEGINYIIFSYNNQIYQIKPNEYKNLVACINETPKAKFDSSNKFKCKIDKDETDKDYYDAEIYKFDGKASNLVKVTSSILYNSTDGSSYPILIYKDGSIETTSEETNKNLKDYKIKDFISEKCDKFSDGMTCDKGKITYKVILQDEAEKTINY